jgi:hypothetical protein
MVGFLQPCDIISVEANGYGCGLYQAVARQRCALVVDEGPIFEMTRLPILRQLKRGELANKTSESNLLLTSCD